MFCPTLTNLGINTSLKVLKDKVYLGCSRNHGSQHNMSVGFIGLGQMGSHMAKQLLHKFRNVYVFDVNNAASTRLAEEGAIAVNDLSELSDVDCVVSMLPASQNVLDVYQGSGDLLSKVRAGSLVIDCSTVDPEVPQQLAAQATRRRVSFVDAPVSGGIKAAERGELTFMVGGGSGEVELSTPVLLAMGRQVVHCGPTGSGQVAKLCNNLLLAIAMAGTAEAMNLGIRLGIDPKVLAKVINSSSGRCWASESYNPVPGVIEGLPSANGYKGGFASKLMMKDLNLAHSVAERSNTSIPFGENALLTYKSICAQNMADLDFSVIYQYIKDSVQNNKT